MKTIRMAVEVSDPERLARRIGVSETPGKESARRTKPVELERQIGTLMAHARKLGARGAAYERNRIRSGT
jgi:hypothetical protein